MWKFCYQLDVTDIDVLYLLMYRLCMMRIPCKFAKDGDEGRSSWLAMDGSNAVSDGL